MSAHPLLRVAPMLLALLPIAALAADPFPTPFSLNTLDGSNGFAIAGLGIEDTLGYAVSSAGDVNADGIPDLIIGAQQADAGDVPAAGVAYVVFGGQGVGAPGSFDVTTLDGLNGFVIRGVAEDDWCGAVVSCAGDMNGDGADDLLVCAPYADPGGNNVAGEAYVVFGGASAGAGGVVDLAALDGSNGFILRAGDSDFLGVAGACAGDLNADGFDDIVIGEPSAYRAGESFPHAGRAYVVFGSPNVGAAGLIDLAALDGHDGLVFVGSQNFDQCGGAVSSAGDVNADGVGDLIVGADHALGGGRSYVIFGGPDVGAGGIIPAESLNGSNGFTLPAVSSGDWSGSSVSGVGDVNADGVADFLIGAVLRDGACVVFGAPGIGASGSLPLASLDGSNGFVIEGVYSGSETGYSVSGAGDLNNDGIDDLLIGAGFGHCAYVVFGKARIGETGSLLLAALDGVNGFAVVQSPTLPWGRHDTSVANAGDFNDDGVDDLLIGVPYTYPTVMQGLEGPYNVYRGESYVLFGRPTPPPHCVADLDGNNTTDVFDFAILVQNFGAHVPPGTSGDLDDNGWVTVLDFAILVSDFACHE